MTTALADWLERARQAELKFAHPGKAAGGGVHRTLAAVPRP